MERYDSYKDSGVDWIGQIPEHWELMHLRNFISLFSEKGFGDLQLLSVTREKGVILRDKNNLEENHNFVPDDLSGYKHVKVGDFVINKMKSWQGSYGISKFEGIVSPAYYTCKLSGVNPEFFSNAIRSKIYSAFFMQFSKGVRVGQWDLDSNAMKSIPFILPPISEQQAIAAYLDDETGKLDAAVEKLERMVEVLKERKQLIISKAVTRGLDDSVPLKDSGVEWIGQIPEHWNLRKIKSVSIFNPSKKTANLDLVGYAPMECIRTGAIEIRSISFKQLPTGLTYFENGDLVVAKVTPCFENNNIAIAKNLTNGCAFGSSELFVFRPTNICDKFLFYYFQDEQFKNKCCSTMRGTGGLKRVQSDFVLNAKIPYPDLSEQQAIAAYLDEKVGKLDEAIEKQLRMIELLKERKQILISDVVTGKIKVA